MANVSFTRALVVENDAAVADQIKESLKKIKMSVIQSSTTAEDAISIIETSNPPFDLIFVSLALPQTAGGILLQFIKSHPVKEIRECVVIALAETLSKEDYYLLNEINVLDCLKKPFDHQSVIKKMTDILTQQSDPESERNIYSRFYDALLSRKYKEAEEIIIPYLKQSPNSPKYLTFYAALLFKTKKIDKCEEFLNKILKIDKDYLPALNLLSKVLVKLKRYDEALDTLDKAQKLNSKNIDRLLVIGELYLAGDDLANAESNFRGALNLSPRDQRAIHGLSRTLTTQGRIDEGKKLLKTIARSQDMASFFNSKGILLVRAGKNHEGINLYLNAVKLLDDSDLEYLLLYNISLAYTKIFEYEKALEYAKLSAEKAPEFYTKSKKLCDKLENDLTFVKAGINPITLTAVNPDLPFNVTAGPQPSGIESEENVFLLTQTQEEFIMNGEGPESDAASTPTKPADAQAANNNSSTKVSTQGDENDFVMFGME